MNKISFKGYENVYAGTVVNPDINSKLTVLSVKLNDNDGYADLSEFKKLKELAAPGHYLSRSDVMTFIHQSTPLEDTIYVGDKMYLTGTELKTLGQCGIPQMLSKQEFADVEKEHLKLFTLITSLTKRMKNSDQVSVKDDSNIFANMLRAFKSLTGNDLDSLNIVECFKTKADDDLKKTSDAIYKFMSKSMKNYF